MNLLARQAESCFWLGRYLERASSLARILMVQTAFDRGRADKSSWAWLLALYDEQQDFLTRYETTAARNVIRYFVDDREHDGSIVRSLGAAIANARNIRAMISTGLWTQINNTYQSVKEIGEPSLREPRLAATCEKIQIDCYAIFGIADATLFRDSGWRFYRLGREIEQADQMSRLLDVRFAQRQADDADTARLIGDPTHWIMLLRACGGHHAFRRLVSGPTQPENVARFLIFENSFARSLSHSIGQMEGAVDELRRVCSIPVPMSLLKRLNELRDMLHFAQNDPGLTVHLHSFNDALQQELIAITNDVSTHYFVIEVDKSADLLSTPPPSEDQEPDWVQPPDPDKAVQPETAADPASKEAHGSLKHHASQSQKQS